MSRSRQWVAVLMAMSLLGAFGDGASSAQRRPNIVMIVADDWGTATSACMAARTFPRRTSTRSPEPASDSPTGT